MGRNDLDPIELIIGGMFSVPIINGILKYFQNNQSLSKYQEQWKILTRIIEKRKAKLNEYKLFDVLNFLEGKTKEVYIEAIGSYLCGLDLAASNMICLAIEVFLREKTKNNEDRLYDLIEGLVETHNLDPQDLTFFHTLRKKRNIQVHTADKFEELTILGMFKTMGDITIIFHNKTIEKLM